MKIIGFAADSRRIMNSGQFFKRTKFYYFPIFLLLLLLLLTSLRLHGSSVGIYNYFFYGSDKDPNLIYGHPRGIRSDEWLVLTPWTVSQVHNDFKPESSIYLAGQNFLFSDIPTKHWSTIFKPQNLLFLILPVEYAFSFKWWFKGFLLIFSLYLIFMLITNENYFISIMGSIAAFFTPTIQWWYSTSAPETISFAALALYFFIQAVQKMAKKERWGLNLFLFSYFAICFGFIFYPPFQIPSGLTILTIGGLYLLLVSKKHSIKPMLVPILGALSVIIFTGMLFYIQNKDPIYKITNTSYPGKRFSLGKDASFLPKVIYGFYNLQLLYDKNIVPPILGNQSEASSFSPTSLLLLPLLGIVIASSTKRNSPEKLLTAGCAAIPVLLFVWGIFGLPQFLAKALLLQYVPPSRSIPYLAVMNIVGCVYFLTASKYVDQSQKLDILRIVSIIYVFLFVLAIGIHLREKYPQYIYNPLKILVISSANAVLVGALAFRKEKTAMGMLLLLSFISSAQVNPIYRGLSPLQNSEVISELPARKNDVVFASYYPWLTNYLAANGFRVLNGTYYFPNVDFWHSFDPNGDYLHIYNRYAHIFLTHTNDPDQITISLMQQDVVQIEISPCNKKLEEIGVNHFLSNFPLENVSCLNEKSVIRLPNTTLYIYENPSVIYK